MSDPPLNIDTSQLEASIDRACEEIDRLREQVATLTTDLARAQRERDGYEQSYVKALDVIQAREGQLHAAEQQGAATRAALAQIVEEMTTYITPTGGGVTARPSPMTMDVSIPSTIVKWRDRLAALGGQP